MPKFFNQTAIGVVVISLLGLSGFVFSAAAATDPAALKGLEIVTEAQLRDFGFGDVTSDLEMTLRNRHGEQTVRIMRNKTLEQEADGDKAMIIFDSPRDVKGTAFLSFTHKQDNDDQWLFLPALKRVKRIASSNKSGPFMGSEFAYEDISSQEVEKYSYKYLRDETFDDRQHFVIEYDPVDPRSGYSSQIVWLDKAEYRPWKIDFYDRKGDLMKTLVMSNYHQYLDQYWRADEWSMENHQTGKSTILKFANWKFRNGFSDKDFTKNSLKRAR